MQKNLLKKVLHTNVIAQKKRLTNKRKCKKQGIPYVYNRKWRDPKDLKIPKDVKPVIRFKSKISGNTIIKDLVQGEEIYQILQLKILSF